MRKLLDNAVGLLMAFIFFANLIYINPYLHNIYEVTVTISFIFNGLIAPFIVLASVVALFWGLEVKAPYDEQIKEQFYKACKDANPREVWFNQILYGIIYGAQVLGLTLNGNTYIATWMILAYMFRLFCLGVSRYKINEFVTEYEAKKTFQAPVVSGPMKQIINKALSESSEWENN